MIENVCSIDEHPDYSPREPGASGTGRIAALHPSLAALSGSWLDWVVGVVLAAADTARVVVQILN